MINLIYLKHSKTRRGNQQRFFVESFVFVQNPDWILPSELVSLTPDLTFINIKFSFTFLNNILSFSSPQIFVFLIFTFVNICQSKVLSEERQLMKWVGIFWVWTFCGGGEEFSRGCLMGGNFTRTTENKSNFNVVLFVYDFRRKML